MGLEERRIVWIAITGLLVLLAISPALSRVLVLPRNEFFTELWILGPNHKAEDYPFSISRNNNYSVFLGIANHLGYCAYYLVEVKLGDQTQSAPDVLSHTSSSLPALYNITAFVADEEAWELPLRFSFDYKYNETFGRVEVGTLRLNDVVLNMTGYTIAWDPLRKGFFGYLLFELWLYNKAEASFQYHERSVILRLDMILS